MIACSNRKSKEMINAKNYPGTMRKSDLIIAPGQLLFRIFEHIEKIRLGAVADRLGDGLAVLEDYEHRYA